MTYDILCHNCQNGNGEELYIFYQVSYDKRMGKCLIIPKCFLALLIFPFRCFFKDKLELSIRGLLCFLKPH